MSDAPVGSNVAGSPNVAVSPVASSNLSPVVARLNQVADYLKAHQKLILFAGISLQTIVLVAMVVMHGLPYVVGERILLKVVPVDPRDMFRGDFVVLNYEISRLPPEGIPGIQPYHFWWSRRTFRTEETQDRTVYVTVEPEADGRHWHAVKFSTERPATGKYLQGTYSARNFGSPLQFGIEAYFVEEGQGRELESLRNSKHLSAEIAVAHWGQAKLVRLVEE
jgi:uncharacterized membrane-anchored protein